MALEGLRRVDGGLAAPPYAKGGEYEWDSKLRLKNVLNPDRLGLSMTRYELRHYFNRLPQLNASVGVATDLDFEIAGTNASNDDVTHASTVGGVQLETDGASGDQVIVLPHLDAGQSAWEQVNWGTENEVVWECLLRTAASIADVTLWAGLKLTSTPVVATDANQAFFRFDGNVANWEATTSIADSDVETDTGVAVAADTFYHLRIELDADRKAHYVIDGVEKHVSDALTDDIDLTPFVGVQADAGSAKALFLVAQYISRDIFE